MTRDESLFCRRDIPFRIRWSGGYAILCVISLCSMLARKIPAPFFDLEKVMAEGFLGEVTFWLVMLGSLFVIVFFIPLVLHWLAYYCVVHPTLRFIREKEKMRIISSADVRDLPRISPGEDLAEETE